MHVCKDCSLLKWHICRSTGGFACKFNWKCVKFETCGVSIFEYNQSQIHYVRSQIFSVNLTDDHMSHSIVGFPNFKVGSIKKREIEIEDD